MRSITWLWVVLAGCAHTVAQDQATGVDGRIKGARPLKLDNNSGRVRGIVSYPGGDRIDWRSIELPPGRSGTLDLKMTYTTPRPGLRLAFDVFDQWNAPVAKAAIGKARIRMTSIDHASGRYFVRIYAPRRADAGTYKLVAAFTPEPERGGGDPLSWQIPDPPKLPDANEPPPAPAAAVPPAIVAPPAPLPPAPPAVVAIPAIDPIVARVLKVDMEPDGLLIKVSIGSENGVGKTWKAQVLRGDSSAPLSGGVAAIVRVDRRTTTLRVKLTTDQISANPNVRLGP